MTRSRSTFRGVGVVLAAVLAVSAIAPRGFADAYDAAMARAVAAKEKAVDSNDPAAWEEALRLFLEADAIKPTKDSKYELANAAIKLKEDDLAYESYEEAIALGLSGKAKEKAQTFLSVHKNLMGHLEVKGPAGAEVWIGPRKRATLPHAPIVVFAGPVKLRVVFEGRQIDEALSMKEGGSVTLDVTAKLAPPPAPTATTTATATAAPTASAVPTVSPSVPLSDTGAGARTLGWSLTVSGAILTIGAGVGVIVTNKGLSDRLDTMHEHCLATRSDNPDQCLTAKPGFQGEVQSDNDAVATWKGARTASYITGGVGLMILGVGLLRLATAPEKPQASALAPTMSVGANGAYFGLSGAF